MRCVALALAGNASQKYCVGQPAAPAASVALSAKMTSPKQLVSASKPSAHEPTTTHTPSGGAPPRTCATIGERCPMQSITRRARSSAPSRVLSTAAPGRMVTAASGVRSSTTPPLASNRWRA